MKKGTRNGTKIALDIPLSCLSSTWLYSAERSREIKGGHDEEGEGWRLSACFPPPREAFQLQNPAKSPGDSRQLLAHPLYLLCLALSTPPPPFTLPSFTPPFTSALSPMVHTAGRSVVHSPLTKTEAGERERAEKKKDTQSPLFEQARVNTGVRQNRTGKARESQTDTSIFMSRFPFHVSNPPLFSSPDD